jgi:hypothetical protein
MNPEAVGVFQEIATGAVAGSLLYVLSLRARSQAYKRGLRGLDKMGEKATLKAKLSTGRPGSDRDFIE